MKPGYIELRTKYTPNIVELYSGMPRYHEQLYAKWLSQYKENSFDNNAVLGIPAPASNLDFRMTYTTFGSYVYVKIQSIKNKNS